jgi:quercetin dioxygenase-like cupin family protein
MRAMKMIVSAALFCVLVGVVCAQEKAVPVGEEGHHQLVLENEYTRVFHVVLAPKESTLMHQHDRDYVYVMIGSSQVESLKQGAAPTQMKLNDGDVKFTKGPLTHKVTNVGDTPFVNLTIEVKKASTKSVCGASWAGVGSAGTACGVGGRISGGDAFVDAQNLETVAVAADTLTVSTPYVVGDSDRQPTLLVPLTALKAGVTGKQLKPWDTLWIAASSKVSVASNQAGPAKFVLVKFR